MRVIIAGSRSITDYSLLKKCIAISQFNINEVVSGKAKGVDSLGERWARENNVFIKEFPANWGDISHPKAVIRYRKGKPYDITAGLRRNIEMAEYAEGLILLWDKVSKGSKHMWDEAEKRNLFLWVFDSQANVLCVQGNLIY